MNRKTQTQLKRREFLNTAAGSVAWGVFLGTVLPASQAAETAAKVSPRSSALDELLAEMEAQGKRFLSVPRPGCQLLQL